MPFAAILSIALTASCSKDILEGNYSRDSYVVVDEKDSTDIPYGGGLQPGADINSGDGMIDNKPVVDGWDDSDAVDMIVS